MYWEATCLIKLECTKEEMYPAPNTVLPQQNLMWSNHAGQDMCGSKMCLSTFKS